MAGALPMPGIKKKMAPRFRSMFDLHARMAEELSKEEAQVLERVWQLSAADGPTVVPGGFGEKLQAMFAGMEGAKAAVENQRVLRCWNVLMDQSTYFNDVRAAYTKSRTARRQVARAVIIPLATPETCDFCNLEARTSTDVGFGRLSAATARSCSNVAKYAGSHSCIVFNDHNPLVPAGSKQCIADLFTLCDEWALHKCPQFVAGPPVEPYPKKQRTSERGQWTPLIGWNCTSKAGASMEHGHAQVLSVQGNVRWAAALDGTGAAAVVAAARTLGLLVEIDDGRAYTFPSLSPVQNAEMWVVAKPGSAFCEGCSGQRTFGPDAAEGIRTALEVLFENYSTSAFNITVASVACAEGARVWPDCTRVTFARVLDRGVHTQLEGPGFLEIFGSGSVGGADPFTVFEQLHAAVAELAARDHAPQLNGS
ncbi:hypothetical protein DIPPA_09131 [Diplonema papillatum]|nr:hypothetical protein DIPPA_09131 [Diplonema papillatum]